MVFLLYGVTWKPNLCIHKCLLGLSKDPEQKHFDWMHEVNLHHKLYELPPDIHSIEEYCIKTLGVKDTTWIGQMIKNKS